MAVCTLVHLARMASHWTVRAGWYGVPRATERLFAWKRMGRHARYWGITSKANASTVQMIESEYQPNGIVFSPDEKYLYVGGGGKIWRYDVKADDTVSNRKVFYPDTGCDGMKMDQKGNLYCASRGIEIFSPEGKHLGTIQTP